MAMMGYLAGLLTLPALCAGATVGMAYWRAVRRSEGHTEGPRYLTPVELPPPPLPQDQPTVNRISFASGRGRRQVRGRR